LDIRNKKFKTHSAEVKTDALNDILFILLFFFLIMALMQSPNVIKLPQPSSKKTEKSDQRIIVNIAKVNNIVQMYVGTQPVKDENELIGVLTKQLKEIPAAQPTIGINADSTVPIYYVTRMMNIGNRLSAKTVLLAAKEN
jgi:biopolymer transport protein ExbD